ncbi:MAG: aspartate--tRNA ligase [Fimbriimonadales bacterium]|nr:aspartate--tRNA ligase [Fimbriimonadales bacterium]
MSFRQRTHTCGELRAEHVGETVTLNGWCHRIRDLGGLFFVDLRDRTGICQLNCDVNAIVGLEKLRSEFVVAVTGKVAKRTPEAVNTKIPTGEIELIVEELAVLNECDVLPFPVSDEEQMDKVSEELRIKYRYLDLRRPSMYQKLAVRAALVSGIRKYLDDRGFLEVETPIFTRSTPEGARDYLVPYRLEPGKFYALPQSPQQYKQLLMVGGIDRYYQIAKCFRDEAQRADRQPEFTQLDLEMSFPVQEDILQLTEGLTCEVCNSVIEKFGLDFEPVGRFPRLTYDESMTKYATDKPDLRFDLEVFDITDIAKKSAFGVFQAIASSGGIVRGIRYPGGAELSRNQIGELETFAKEFGAKGLANIPVVGVNPLDAKGIAKFFSPEELAAILDRAGAKHNDLLLFVADVEESVLNVLGRLRNLIGERCGLRDPRKLVFCWILDFPLVFWDKENQRWEASHHPFTGPKSSDIEFLESDPGRVRAECYDVVCNGVEWASGSIRIHRPDIQSRVFNLLGIDEATQQARFGHILEAFRMGAPPHGGIAPGIDRLAMFLLGEDNIREVMAFPKIGGGYDPLMDTPSEIDQSQWDEIGLQLKKPIKE